eukprot:3368252-Prymnesium_polylepis.1
MSTALALGLVTLSSVLNATLNFTGPPECKCIDTTDPSWAFSAQDEEYLRTKYPNMNGFTNFGRNCFPHDAGEYVGCLPSPPPPACDNVGPATTLVPFAGSAWLVL